MGHSQLPVSLFSKGMDAKASMAGQLSRIAKYLMLLSSPSQGRSVKNISGEGKRLKMFFRGTNAKKTSKMSKTLRILRLLPLFSIGQAFTPLHHRSNRPNTHSPRKSLGLQPQRRPLRVRLLNNHRYISSYSYS